MDFSIWEDKKLGDVLNFRRGHDLPKKEIVFGKYPVIGSNGIIGYHNECTTKGPCITIGRSGNVGKPHFSSNDCWAHNTTLYVDDFKGNDPRFLFYFLKTLELSHYGGGSAVPTLNRNHIHPINIKIPINVNEQKSIANILTALDEKIETNNQINKKLEEMAQAIFKQWFVDFEFPNENGKPYKSSGGEMVESELVMIPKGWRVGSATEQFSVQSGGTPKTNAPEYWNGEIPFFTPKDSHVSSIFVIDTEKTITNEGLSKCNSKLYDVGTVFITARGTVGNVAMAGRKMAMNQSCYALIPNEGFNYNYIYFLIIQLVKTLQMNASGSVFDAIIVSTFSSLKTVIPSKEIVEKFNPIVQNLFSLVLNNIKENKKLETIRDTLLPKLMSGEIRVPIES